MKTVLLVLLLAALTVGGVVAASVIFMLPPICSEQIPSTNACLNNLRQIEAAKQKWAEATGARSGARSPAADVNQYFREKTMPECPAGGTYTYNALGVHPTCSMSGVALPSRWKQRLSLFRWRWSEPECIPLEAVE